MISFQMKDFLKKFDQIFNEYIWWIIRTLKFRNKSLCGPLLQSLLAQAQLKVTLQFSTNLPLIHSCL